MEEDTKQRIGTWFVVSALIMALVGMTIVITYILLPPPPEPRCGYSAFVGFSPTPTLFGYDFEVVMATEEVPLDCFTVNVSKTGASLWPSPDFPKTVEEGLIGVAAEGERLSFSDVDEDGRIGLGDRFSLELLYSGTEYTLYLLDEDGFDLIFSRTITTP